MTTYKVLKGTNIQAVSSDPSNPIEGQVWYNTTDNVTKGRGATTAGSWSSGGNLNTGRRAFGGAGTQTSALAFGGTDAPGITGKTESYDGTSWTEGNDLNQIRHYETKEVKDSFGRLILPSGKVVDSGFTIPDPSSPTATLNPVSGVTNFEYETKLNEAKRSIYVVTPQYLQLFLNDMRDIMNYSDSSQFIDIDLIQTENTRNTDPN